MKRDKNVVIPKEGKELNNYALYRSISLINMDTKIFVRVLANILTVILPRYVHLDHSGFFADSAPRPAGPLPSRST